MPAIPDLTTSPTVGDWTWPADVRDRLAADRPTPSPRPCSELREDLDALRDLDDDWDGQGAEAPAAGITAAAAALARFLERDGAASPDRIIAGVNGTMYFEWHTTTGYTEIEVVSASRAEVRRVGRGPAPAEVTTLRCPS